MKKANWFYLTCEVLCVLLSIAFALVVCYNNSPLFVDYGSDSPIFLTVGKGLIMGKVPYVDLVENKGPLMFLLNGLPQLVMTGTLGAFLLELLMSLGGCLLILRCARYIQGGAINPACALVPTALYFAELTRHLGGGNFCEEYDVFLTVAALTVLLCCYFVRPKNTLWHSFALGLTVAGVALIKISDIFGVGVTVPFYIAYVLREKKPFWKEAGAFAGGMAAVAAPVFGYLIATGSVGAMMREYIFSNFSYISGPEQELGFLAQRWVAMTDDSLYARQGWQPVWIMLIAVATGLLLWRRKGPKDYHRELLLYGLSLALVTMAATYVSLSGFEQHQIPLAAPMMLAGLILTAALSQPFNDKGPWVNGAAGLAGLGLAAWIAVQAEAGIYYRPLVTSQEYQTEKAYQTELLEEIDEEYRDSVFCIGVPRRWYCYNQIIPAYKYMNLVNFIYTGVGTGCDTDFERWLEENELKYLVVNGNLEDYRGILTDDTLQYINDNYQLDTVDSREVYSLYELI